MTDKKDSKGYRSVSIRLLVDDYDNFEKAREILQQKVEKAGVKATVSKPDFLNHLVRLFFEHSQKQ